MIALFSCVLTSSCNIFITFTFRVRSMIVYFLISSYALILFGTFGLVLQGIILLLLRMRISGGKRYCKSLKLYTCLHEIVTFYDEAFGIILLLYSKNQYGCFCFPYFSLASAAASTKCNCISMLSIRTHSIIWSWWAIFVGEFFLLSHMQYFDTLPNVV